MAREVRASVNGPQVKKVCPEGAFVVADSHRSVRPGTRLHCGVLRLATSRGMRVFRLLVAVLLAALALADAGPAHSQAKLDADYAVTLLGIPIAHITWTVAIQPDQFSAAANGSTSGLLRTFSAGSGTASANGSVGTAQPKPANFALNITNSKGSDGEKIVFTGGHAKEYLDHPQTTSPSWVPLTEAHRVGVIDPMTALLFHVPGNGNLVVPQACQRKIAVFDGHMRYDLQVAFKRLDTVRANAGYQGPVVVCSVSFSPVAGYEPGRYTIKYVAAQHDIEIWLAPVAGTRLLAPFRAYTPTPLGPGILQATRFVVSPQSSAMNSH
jgi:predicted small integral membrane protein